MSLPSTFDPDGTDGTISAEALDSLRADPEAFRALAPDEKARVLRAAGAAIGDGVDLGEGSLVVAPRIVIEDGVRIGPRATIVCEEVVAIGELSQFGADLELRCRRAFLGAGIWAGRSIRFGGGGHRDPWATLVVGDLAFVGDEAFVNVCRPVLIGREVFLTMRSLIVTHNIGHSVLEGFENRFAPVVLEDRSQVGLGAVLYAGSRIGAEAIVASSSYVVGDVPAGAFAIGVPAKVTGSSSHKLSEARRTELARRMIDDLHELLALRGHAVSPVTDDGFEVDGTRVLFTPSYRGGVDGPAVVLALAVEGDVPAASPFSTSWRGRSTGTAARCSTPSASSAASAGSGSSRAPGATRAVSSAAIVGQAFHKYGRTTGFQQGAVVDTNLCVDVCYLFLFVCFQEARFTGQISISPGSFSAPGDSGSLIVTQRGNQPLALLFARGDVLTIGTPIDLVLQRFGVTIDGLLRATVHPRRPPRFGAIAGDVTRLTLLERSLLRRHLADL